MNLLELVDIGERRVNESKQRSPFRDQPLPNPSVRFLVCLADEGLSGNCQRTLLESAPFRNRYHANAVRPAQPHQKGSNYQSLNFPLIEGCGS